MTPPKFTAPIANHFVVPAWLRYQTLLVPHVLAILGDHNLRPKVLNTMIDLERIRASVTYSYPARFAPGTTRQEILAH